MSLNCKGVIQCQIIHKQLTLYLYFEKFGNAEGPDKTTCISFPGSKLGSWAKQKFKSENWELLYIFISQLKCAAFLL